MLNLLINYDIEALFKTYEKYSRIFGLLKFYERLLTPVMYKVGELWIKVLWTLQQNMYVVMRLTVSLN